MDQHRRGPQSRCPVCAKPHNPKEIDLADENDSLVLPLALAAAFGAQAATTTIPDHSENGNQIGEQVVERDDDGLTKVRFIYKDNGRGPDLTEQFRLGPDGTMTEYSVKGNSTFGAVVDEHFSRKGDQAEWKSTSEQGKKSISGPAAYLPLNGSFEVESIAIAALAHAPDGKLALLPSGTLSQRARQRGGRGANGQKQTVRLLAQTGVGLSPSFYWATSGDQAAPVRRDHPRFCQHAGRGLAAAAPELAARQKKAESKMLADVAAKLQHPLEGLTVVRNARVFDSDKATVGPASDIYVLRGRITAVLPAGSPVRDADNTIDAGGRIVLPGLFDLHGHVDRWGRAGHVGRRDQRARHGQRQRPTAGDAGRNRRRQAAGAAGGAGRLPGRREPVQRQQRLRHQGPGAAKSAIDWYAERGYPQLKIYNSFPKAILKETVAYAHSRGMRVSGHIPAGLRAQEALDAGYDEIQHINQVLLNFLVKPDTETRNLNRFVLPAEKWSDLDFNAKPVKDFVAFLAKKQISIDPTLATFAFLKQRDGDMNEPYAAVASHMPPDVARGFSVGTMKIDGDAAAQAL
jgi:hypothetical protein